MRGIDAGDELVTREVAAYVLASLGIDLDAENFATCQRTGARLWAGLGSWGDRLGYLIRQFNGAEPPRAALPTGEAAAREALIRG